MVAKKKNPQTSKREASTPARQLATSPWCLRYEAELLNINSFARSTWVFYIGLYIHIHISTLLS